MLTNIHFSFHCDTDARKSFINLMCSFQFCMAVLFLAAYFYRCVFLSLHWGNSMDSFTESWFMYCRCPIIFATHKAPRFWELHNIIGTVSLFFRNKI